MIYETERLLVRHITSDDLDVMYEIYSNPKAMLWVGDGSPLTRERCIWWIDKTLNNYEKYGYGMSAIVLRESNVVIGFCGLIHPVGRVLPEIKYALLEEYWGRGIATECAQGMLAYGADTFGMTEIIASIAQQNVVSRHILEKLGMILTETRHNKDGTTTEFLSWKA